jgi:RluA family pseudouridine synthase
VDRGYVVTVFLSTHLVGYEPVSLLYKDDDVLVVNKGPGILTVSKDGNASVLAHLKRQFGDSVDAVHRLDRDTSGVIVFSRNAASTERLLDQFRRRTVKKVYEAVAHQTPRLSIPPKGLWKSELALVKKFPVPRWGSVLKGGETAITAYRVLGSGGGLTRLELSPKTGRTHQLRVHCSEHGLPLVGDAIYGTPERDRKVGATKLLLHARKVTFLHPRSQKALSVEAPVPAYFPVSLPVT